jgi:hypothetical protein
MTMKTRLARLETVQIGNARVIVIGGPAGMDAKTEMRARGVEAVARDLVVVLAKPLPTPVSVTVDGQPVLVPALN